MDQWLARKLHEQDRKLEAVSRGGIGIGNSSVTGGSLEVEGDHAISLGDGGINYIAGPPPPKPTAPTLQAGVGSIFVTWDGLWAEANDADETELDTEAPLDFDRIEVHCSTDPAEADWGEDTMQGEIKAKAGGTVSVKGGDIDDEVFVCLIGLSKAGEHGEASDTASVIIEGIDIATITSELDAANVDLSNLNGDMFAADAEIDAAKIALKNVDLAVISTDDGTLADALSDARDLSAELANQAKADAIADAAGKDATLKTQIDGTIAQARTDLEGGISSAEARAKAEAKTLSDAARDSANTFTSTRVFGPTQIADNAITTAKLAAGSVEADKIKAGAVGAVAIAADSIEGRHVKASTITANKMLIGDFSNLVDDPALLGPGWAGNVPFTFPYTVQGPGNAIFYGGTTGGYAQNGNMFPTMPDTKYRLSCRFQNRRGAPVLVHIHWLQHDKTPSAVLASSGVSVPSSVSAVWADFEVTVTAPSDARFGVFRITYPDNSSTGQAYMIRPAVRRLVGSTLIEDGAITTDKILADAITANKVAANTIGARAIAADAIEAGKIAANAVTSREIIANAITAEKIVGLAVTTEKLAALAVSADKIAANAVVAGKIAANAVTAGTISALAVTADKIAANAITADKIAANAVTAGSIQAGAINGMEIIGPDIYTSKTGSRAHVGGVGIELYGPNEKRTFFAETATGNVSMTGSFFSNDAGLPRVEIDNDDWANIGIIAPDGTTRYTNGAGIRIGSTATAGFSIYHGAYYTQADANVIEGQAGIIEGPLGRTYLALMGVGEAALAGTDSGGAETARFTAAGLEGNANMTAKSGGKVVANIHVDKVGAAQMNGMWPTGRNAGVVNAFSDGTTQMLSRDSAGGAKSIIRTTAAGNVELQATNDVLMTISSDSGGRLRVPAIYNVTASGTANVVVNSSGTLFRPSSSRRYKQDIEDFAPRSDILDIQTKTWRDIRAVADSEKAHDYLAEIGEGPLPPSMQDMELEPARHFGAIAEEVHELGLTELVEYDDFGRPDALKYPMFGVALIPAIRDLRDRITQLEERINV